MKFRVSQVAIFLAIATVAAIIASVLIGSVSFDLRDMFTVIRLRLTGAAILRPLAGLDKILFTLRIPRTLMMLLTGAALACSGASYQGLFRNPLADPYLIGVSTGAGLGAVIAMSIRWQFTRLGTLMVPLMAFVFALGCVWIVFKLGKINGALNTTGLILAGVAMNAFASALTSVWMLISRSELRMTLSWMLGGMTRNSWDLLAVVIPPILIGMIGQLFFAHPLNVLQFGEEEAGNLGISVKKLHTGVVLLSTLTTAAAISFAGIIGFVGLIVPHVLRFFIGGDYRRLIPLSMLGGAFFLLLSDILARVVLAPQELPVGIITALTGAPFFLWLLNRTRRQEVN